MTAHEITYRITQAVAGFAAVFIPASLLAAGYLIAGGV